jgi:hypothetical protein
MKLSEAIRLGCEVVENDRALFLSPFKHGQYQGVHGCAIGAALYAVGFQSLKEVLPTYTTGYDVCETVWPWVSTKLDDNESIASHLSIRHGLGESREALADWIERLEGERGVIDGQEVFKGQAVAVTQ